MANLAASVTPKESWIHSEFVRAISDLGGSHRYRSKKDFAPSRPSVSMLRCMAGEC